MVNYLLGTVYFTMSIEILENCVVSSVGMKAINGYSNISLTIFSNCGSSDTFFDNKAFIKVGEFSDVGAWM